MNRAPHFVLFSALVFLAGCDYFQSSSGQCDFLTEQTVYGDRKRATEADCPYREKGAECPWIRIGANSSYSLPLWHPDADKNLIIFWHRVLNLIEYPYGEQCQAYYHYQGAHDGTWAVQGGQGSMVRLSRGSLSYARWSPDGRRIAFERGGHIFRMDFDGSCFDAGSETQITQIGRNFFPAWSPDGKRIVYHRSMDDALGPRGTWLSDVDGSSHQFVRYGLYPNFDPLGNQIVAVLHSVDFDGTRLILFDAEDQERMDTMDVRPGADIRHPRFSPDGSSIAFVSQLGAEQWSLWIANADGTDPRMLTEHAISFDWSPDGREIVYEDYRSYDFSYCNGTLWMIDVTSGARRQLTHNYLPRE